MVITVVGATGLIGGRVVDLLSGSGTAVRAITRDAARATPRPGVVWAQADLRDPILLEPAFAGTSVLFCSPITSSGSASCRSPWSAPRRTWVSSTS